jgi:hypothetical protein
VEELLAHPGLLLLARSSGDLGELRRALGDLGTVVRVVREAAPADEPCVVDPDDAVGRAYGLGTEGMALVRPDGYLGLIADSGDPALLRSYLADTLRLIERSAV